MKIELLYNVYLEQEMKSLACGNQGILLEVT